MRALLPILVPAFITLIAHGNEPEPLPTLVVPVRVHLVRSETDAAMNTSLLESDVRRIFEKINRIWAQAGIRLEIESIVETHAMPFSPEAESQPEHVRIKSVLPPDALSDSAIDVCYVKQIRPNGFYYGEPVVVKDTARLTEVPGGIDEPLPRVTSHEIGHALGLSHRQDVTNLMASGTTGYSLNEAEIQAARAKAAERFARH